MQFLVYLIVALGWLSTTATASDAERAAALFFGLEQPNLKDNKALDRLTPEKNPLTPQERRPFRRLPTIDEDDKAQLRTFKQQLQQKRQGSADAPASESERLYNRFTEEQKETLRRIREQRELRRQGVID